MIPLKDNNDVASFLVTKHSWKGKYKRVFSIGTHGITTYNPDKLEVTNRWSYSDIITLTCTRHSNSAPHHDFTLVMRKDKKIDTMKFSSEHKYLIMTEAFKYRQWFAEKPKELLRYQAYKHHWSDTRLPVVLEVTPCSLDQLDPATHTVLAHYHYGDIEGIIPLQDYPGGFVVACGGFSRLHLFSAANFVDIRNKILENSINTLGLPIKVLTTTITMEDFQNQRFGKYSGDQHQTSISEFVVHKVSSARHMEPPRRILCLSDTCILERDPQTYSVCCLRPLADVWALVRHPTNPQMFSVEYLNGHVRTYLATERDALLASLMDGVRSAGNRDVHVKMQSTPRGKRFGPLHQPVDEETESNHLRLFQNPGLLSRAEVIERFNANVAYSGLLYSVNQDRLFAENKEKLIAQALQALMQTERNSGSSMPLSELEAQFHALRRLSASKVGFAAFTTLSGLREWVGSAVVAALRRGDAASSHAALDALGALLQPMHTDPDLRQEQLNKCSMLANKPFLNGLLDMWTEHVVQGSGALVVAAMLDFLTFALCVPYSETTEGKHFDQLLEMVAARGRSLFMLFEHPSMAIVKGAGLVMRALVEEGASGGRMQALALAEAALPRHLLAALYGTASGARLAQRQLSRHLVTLWVTGHPPAIALLKRILPAGLLSFLESEEKVPAAALAAERVAERDNLAIVSEASAASRKSPQWLAIDRQLKYVEKHLEHYTQLALQHWALHTGMTLERKEKLRERPIVLRKRRENIKSESNWPYFYYQFSNDHALPNLIWNHKTREELRNALENELRAFTSERELAGDVLTAWNHTELELVYHCLQDEVKIGDYYLRILLQSEDSPYCPIRKSYEFFNELYHRFLLTPKVEMKCMCLQAMAVVYARYYEDIGPFPDTKFIVQMLDRTTDRMERDRLVIFLNKLILHRRNVRELLEWNGVRILVELMTLAHLHTSRATVPAQSNVLEAAPSVAGQQADKEWYYHVENGGSVNRVGPVSCKELGELLKAQKITSRTKCWANSMDGWRAMQAIPQLKWTLLARGSPVLNESELATLILNLLIKCCQYFPSRDEDNAIIRPLPKVKRLLSEPVLLAHVVQILLTFDPVLVEKVATLLYEVMQDNSEVSKLYMTGVFYFILMYTGSNVLPIARFLQLTHMKQAFRPDESASSDIMQRSILGQLLPEAMVCYIHNHGAEKFAQIFLGEYDTPEAIWNSEMRRMLIVKVSAHIGEFTPRLRAHVAARYPYLGMPVVRYPQLQHELFCNVFYLRHLCDTTRFPDWPIPDPVRLLKDVLEAWRAEVEKKPPAMTVEEAYGALGLAPGRHHEEAHVRKAYYKLAQQYHPDKNPEGRDRFESVNQAYEFLCSRSVWSCDGPNTNNIVLVLRTQTILFNRYSQELSAYKYAGYPQLLRTVSAQAESDTLFQESGGALLAAACALAHATVHSSPLNAEELQREGGLQVLHDAFTRCVSVLSASSKPSDLAAEVCVHCCRCFAVAAQFSTCRDVMAAIPQLLTDIVRILHFNQLGELCCAAAEACGALAAHSEARVALVRAHALHVLLASALNYDYTLDEGGVEKEAHNNKQEVSNQLAKLSIVACGKLGSYVGHETEAPADANIRSALETLLTPYLYAKLADDSPEELLKILNSNWRNPYLVWDNSTRAELSEFLETGKGSTLTSEEDILTQDFHYSAHEGHLLVGNVFVQIYNEQPTFPIENAKGFTLDLLQFLNERVQEAPSEERMTEMEMVLTALANVIVENPGVEIQCIGQFGLIFGLLSSGHAGVTHATLAVVRAATRSGECVEDAAASAVLGHLLALLSASRPQHHADALVALAALLTNTRIVREALQKGCVIYLLDLFCNSRIPETRESAADLLARMMADKLHGPKVRLSMSRHVPAVFGEAMRESGGSAAGGGAAAAHMFDSSHQHPELVWDDAARHTVCANVTTLAKQHYAAQQRDANTIWHEPESTSPDAGGWAPPGEVVVGGVYLRLFIASPHWTVRSPKQFLAELLDETLTNLTKDKGESERSALCARALGALLAARPALAEHAARLGHVPRLARLLPACPAHAVPLLRSLADSQLCVTALAQTDCIQGLKEAMKSCTSTVGTACEALSRMFCSPANTDLLVNQALESDMVGHLLRLLEEVAEGQTRAQIVAALKAMARSAAHGERVRAALARSPVWSRYAAQRHDLFIADAPAPGRLGPAAPAAAGYLAAPPANITLQPPPVD